MNPSELSGGAIDPEYDEFKVDMTNFRIVRVIPDMIINDTSGLFVTGIGEYFRADSSYRETGFDYCLDMSAVNFINPEGIGGLVSFNKKHKAERNGQPISIIARDLSNFREVLKLARMDKMFGVYGSVDAYKDSKGYQHV
tara:strand:+ start:329 stop:748 length:420 start_codon:yes stop_codon:yes gene_type:complete